MVKVPLEAIPNQRVSATLGDQKCILHVYQRGDFLFMDLNVDGADVRTGAICLTDEAATGYKLAGFKGCLAFSDVKQEGGTPVWDKLGSRYILFYFEEDEL